MRGKLLREFNVTFSRKSEFARETIHLMNQLLETDYSCRVTCLNGNFIRFHFYKGEEKSSRLTFSGDLFEMPDLINLSIFNMTCHTYKGTAHFEAEEEDDKIVISISLYEPEDPINADPLTNCIKSIS